MRALLIVALSTLAGCAGAPESRPDALPGFVVDALRAPTAKQAKIYVAADGAIEKTVAYVDRSAMPDWVHAMADEHLGAGEDDEFEIEQYADGTRTYEVTRVVDGGKAEMSVTVDRKLRYLERAVAGDAIPAPVKAAIDALSGIEVQRVEHKTGEGIDAYEVVGTEGALEVRLEFDPAGKALSSARRLPAVVQMAR